MLIDLPIKPGVIKDNSELLAEGRWIDADRMRFRNVGGRAYPEIIGGWTALTSQTFSGIARGVHAWNLLDTVPVLAFGTDSGVYVYEESYLWDVTPTQDSGTLNNVLETVSGDATVRITDGSHGVETGATVWLYNDTTIGGVNLGPSVSFLYITVTAGSRIVECQPVGGNHGLLTGDIASISGFGTIGSVGASDINKTHTVVVLDATTFVFALDDVPTSGGQSSAGGMEGLRAYTATKVSDTVFSVELRSGTASSSASSGGGNLDYFYGLNPGLDTATSSEDVRIWVLNNFGEDLTANYPGSVLYRWQGNPSQRLTAVAATDAPQETLSHMVTPERFLVALGTEDAATSTYDPMRVAWASIEGGFSTNDWTPASTNSAGDFRLAEGSKIVAGVAMPFVSLIWTDTALYQIQYTAQLSSVYQPSLLGTSCGLIGPNAYVRNGDSGQVFWLSSTQQFKMWQGGSPVTVQCPVRDYLFDDFAIGQESKVFAGLNEKFNEVWWFYPDATSEENSRYIAFNYAELHWTIGTMPVSAWIERGVFDYPIGLHTDGSIQQHENGNSADGSALDAFIESGFMDAQEGNNLCMWRRYVPDFSGLIGNATVTLKHRMRPQASESTTEIGTVTSSTEKIDFRVTAREVGIRFDFGSTSTAGRLGRNTFDVTPTGAMR